MRVSSLGRSLRIAGALLALVAPTGCAPATSPAGEDACARDQDCGGNLMCCHATADLTADARMSERGFCVKRSVCLNVVAPRQAAPLDE